MAEYCYNFSPEMENQIRALVKAYRSFKGSKKAVLAINRIDGFSRMTLEQKIEAMAAYFKEVISVLTKEGEEPKVPATTVEMDRMLSEMYDRTIQKEMEEQGLRDELPLYISTTEEDGSLGDNLMMRQPLLSEFSLHSEDKEQLAALVERSLRERLDEKFDEKKFRKLLGVVRGQHGELEMEVWYKALKLAMTTDANGKPLITENSLMNVLSGKPQAVRNMIAKYDGMEMDKGDITKHDLALIDILVNRYTNSHLNWFDWLTKNSKREIRLHDGATKFEKLYATAVNKVKGYKAEEIIDFTNRQTHDGVVFIHRELSFKPSEKLMRRAFELLRQHNKAIKGKWSDKDLTDIEEFLIEHLDAIRFYNPERFALMVQPFFDEETEVRFDRDKDGDITNVRWYVPGGPPHGYKFDGKEGKDGHFFSNKKHWILTYSVVTELSNDRILPFMEDLLRDAYDEALSGYEVLEDNGTASLLRDLAKFKGKRFVSERPEYSSFFSPVIVPILNDIKDNIFAEEFLDKVEQNEAHSAAHSMGAEDDTIKRNTTMTAAELRFTSRELKVLTDDFVYGMLDVIGEGRYLLAAQYDEHVQSLFDRAKALHEQSRKLSAEIREPGADKQSIAARQQEIDEEIQRLRDEMEQYEERLKNLHDDSLYMREVLKDKKKFKEVVDGGVFDVTRGRYIDRNKTGEAPHEPEWYKLHKAKVKALLPELTVRAFDRLYDLTGIKITFNTNSLEFEVEDEEAATTADIGVDEDDSGAVIKAEDMDFRDDIDPMKHLTQLIRQDLLYIRMEDGQGKPVLSELGNKQYYDPKDIMLRLSTLLANECVDPEDWCVMIPREQLDNTAKTQPSLLDDGYLWRDPEDFDRFGRTEYDAFPQGKPTFPVLEKYRDRYAWIPQLIYRLEDSYRSYVLNGKDRDQYGKLVREMYMWLGFKHLERMIGAKGHMVVTNNNTDEGNVKMMQKHNFAMRHPNRIWRADGYADFAAADGIKSRCRQLEGYLRDMKGESEEQRRIYGHNLEVYLSFVGIDVIPGSIESEAAGAITKEKAEHLIKLAGALGQLGWAIKQAATTKKRDEDGNWVETFHPEMNVDIYSNARNYWKIIYKYAAPYAERSVLAMTTSENGVKKQNLVLPSTLSTMLDTMGYGRESLEREAEPLTQRVDVTDTAHAAEDSEMLKLRRQKIDRMFRHRDDLFDEETGKYRNTLIQQLYEGNTVVGRQLVSAYYEKKEWLNLNADEVLALQMMGYAHVASQASYIQLPQQADAKEAMFLSVDYRYDKGKKDKSDSLNNHVLGSLAVIARRIQRERDRILRHESMRRPYKMAWAVAHNGNEVTGYALNDNGEYDEFYDVIEGRMVQITGREQRNRFRAAVRLVELYKQQSEAQTQKERDELQTVIDGLKQKYPNAELTCDLHDWQEYERFARHEFRNTYFTTECRFAEIPGMQKMRVTAIDALSNLQAIEQMFNEMYPIITHNGNITGNGLKNRQKMEQIQPLLNSTRKVMESLSAKTASAMSVNGLMDALERELAENLDMLEEGTTADEVKEMMMQVIVHQAMSERLKGKLRNLRIDEYQYSEIANLHRIEKALRQEPDYDGEYWSVEEGENKDGEEAVFVVNRTTGQEVELSEAEAKYYRSRVNGFEKSNFFAQRIGALDPNDDHYVEDYEALATEFYRKQSGTADIQGAKKSYKSYYIMRFEPPLKGLDTLKRIIREQTSRPDNKHRVTTEDAIDYVKRMWWDTHAGGMEMLECLGIHRNAFKSQEEVTKRLKMVRSNGWRMFPGTGQDAHNTEYTIILDDDEGAISDDLPAQLETWADSDLDADEILAKLNGYMNINATDAQGWITNQGYDEKTLSAGSSYSDSRKQETLKDLREGKRVKPGKHATTGTIKQKGCASITDTDPRGNVESVEMIIKNSEALVMAESTAVDEPRSAQRMAFSRYCENKTFEVQKRDAEGNPVFDANGEPVMETVFISTAQRPSAMKGARKGIIPQHWLPSRLQALKDLINTDRKGDEERAKAMAEFLKRYNPQVDNAVGRDKEHMGLDRVMVEEFKRDLRVLAGKLGTHPSRLDFKQIDEHIHQQIEDEARHYIHEKRRGEPDADGRMKNIRQLMNLRLFMQPVKSTEETVNELVEEIRRRVENPDGSMNDQFVIAMPRKYQHMQIRPTDHLTDSSAHLPSQPMYIMPTAIDPDQQYTVAVNGETEAVVVDGDELYDKFNQCVTQHLLLGLKKAGNIFRQGKSGPESLRELQQFLIDAVTASRKNVPEMMRALQLTNKLIEGQTTFSTPLESIAVMYQLSEIFTAIVRNNTHRRGITGANVVIQADSMLDASLGILRDSDNNVVGVECALPAWSKHILSNCLVEREVAVMRNGVETTEAVQTLDINKLKGTGLDKMIGIRIPAEDCHSIIPLVVKQFLPVEGGSNIMVAKEITTLTGGDNDFDKLIMMIKNIDKEAAEQGKLQAVKYDWDAPIEEQSEEQVQNMLIDIIQAIITDKSNESRWLTPQNPDIMHRTGVIMAFSEIADKTPLKAIRNSTGGWERIITRDEVDDFDTNPDYQKIEYPQYEDPAAIPDIVVSKMEEILDVTNDNSVTDIFDICKNKDMHATAKIGVAVSADANSTFAKISRGSEAVNAKLKFKTDGFSKLESGIRFVRGDNTEVTITEYCPKYDVDGNSTYANLAAYSGMLVDAGSSPDVERIGINLDNVFTVEFFLRCGFTRDMAACVANILKHEPRFVSKFDKLYKRLTRVDKEHPENNGEHAFVKDLGAFSMDALKSCQVKAAEGRLFSTFTKIDQQELATMYVMNYLMTVQQNIRPWEHQLKVESASHALSNEPAYAVLEQLNVDYVEKLAAKEEFMVDIPQSMVLHNRVNARQLADGTFLTQNGVEMKSGVARAQAFYTAGVESFNMLMRDQIFYAHPAFHAMLDTMAPMLINMPVKKAVSTIKMLHDDFVAFVLSEMNMTTKGETIRGKQLNGFVEMRDYYRNKFPNAIAPVLRQYRKADSNHAILGVLYKDEDGQLRVNDEMLKNYSIEDVRASLVYLAGGTAEERRIAKDIFLCDYFTGGLKFGKGAISKLFTPSFLANRAFDEYNKTVAELCKGMTIDGTYMAQFLRQFIRGNYNNRNFQFGPLIRAANNIYKDPDTGYWTTGITEHDLKPGEVMWSDVADLDEALADKDVEGHMLPIALDYKPMYGEPIVPYRIKKLLNGWIKDDTLGEGSVFRLQASFNPNEQNLYMLVKNDNNMMCVKKIADALAPKYYDADMDFLGQAEMDCSMDEKGKVGAWSREGTGRMHSRIEEREAFLSGELSNFYKRINEQRKEREEKQKRRRIGQTIYDDFGVGGISDGMDDNIIYDDDTDFGTGAVEIEGMDNTIDFGDNLGVASNASLFKDEYAAKEEKEATRAEGIKYRGNNRYDISMYGTELRSLEEYNSHDEEDDAYDEGEQTDEAAEDAMSEFFRDHPLQAMIQANHGGGEATRERLMQELMEDYGVQDEYDTFKEALNAAKELNAAQADFVAVVEQAENGKSKVTLYDSTDSTAAAAWAEQFGVSVMTDPMSGISGVMDKVGVQVAEHYVEDTDSEATLDDYQSEVLDLIALIKSALGTRTPVILGLNTAQHLVKKLRRNFKVNGFFKIVSDMVNDAVNGEEASVNALKVLLGEERVDSLGQELGGLNRELRADKVEEIAAEVAALAISDPKKTVDDLIAAGDAYLHKRVLNNLAGGVYDELRGNLSQNDATRLEELITQSTAFRSELSRRRQQSARQEQNSVNHNADEVNALRETLERALQMEQQKRRMALANDEEVDDSSDRIGALTAVLGDGTNGLGLQGVLNYLGHIVMEYKYCAAILADLQNHTAEQNLNNLATVKRTLASHEEILGELIGAMRGGALDGQMNKLATVASLNTQDTLKNMVDRIVQMHDSVRSQYAEQGLTQFIGFVKRFIGESDTVRLADGRTVTWEQAFTEFNGDISKLDKLLRPISRMSDPSGQLFSRVVMMEKDEARRNTIDDVQGDILELDRFAVENGISDFEFAFEHDDEGNKTGFILSRVDNKRFQDELEQQCKELRDVLDNPRATQDEKDEASRAFSRWVDKHASDDGTGHLSPNQAAYASAEYERLRREEPKRFEFLEKYVKLKEKLDARLGQQTANARCIQRRMTAEQRLRGYLSLSPSAVFDNLQRQLADEYLIKEDDYMEAGQTSAILNFDGSERLEMPAPYTRMLKNPNELSTDIIGCLMAYSYATNNYTAIRRVMNPLEVGFDILVEKRVQTKKRAGRDVVESFRIGKDKKAVVKESRYFQAIRSFLDSQLYMKYIQDEDDTFGLLGKTFRKSKAANAFTRMSAKAQLGFNWLVDMASFANGVLQTNIEVFSRRYFSAEHLFKADKIYGKEMLEFLPDLNNPIKRSKLALVGQMLDIMQNFDIKVYENRRHSLMAKLTNTNLAFIGTAGGNHWLYFRSAIAYMLNTPVMIPDGNGGMTRGNLWEAIELEELPSGGRRAKLKEGVTDADGRLIDRKMLSTHGERIKEINHDLFGIYNRDDMAMAQKVWYGKLLVAYRKHIVSLMDRRFRKRHRVAAFAGTEHEYQEGYWRTFGKMLLGIRNAQYSIPAAWNNLTAEEQSNVRAAMFDLVQWLAMAMLFKLISCLGGGDDDDDEAALARFSKFLLSREIHEMGSMLPTLYMPKEGINILQMPFMGTNQLADIYNFASTVLSDDWFEQVHGGPFQGQTQIEMRTRKLPIPVLSYYRNIDKSLNGIDNSTWFYSRGYVEHGGMRGK